MKMKALVALIFFCPMTSLDVQGQVRAGSPEYQLFEKITAEGNADTKLGLIAAFEKEFPQSKILSRVYLMAVDVYREKQDRGKINEYGERALQLDGTNITAMMLLARNYAIEAQNLDRAADLAERALARMAVMRGEPLPTGYSLTQWQDYLKATQDSVEQILQYVTAVKARSESVKSSPPGSPVGEPAKASNPGSPQARER